MRKFLFILFAAQLQAAPSAVVPGERMTLLDLDPEAVYLIAHPDTGRVLSLTKYATGTVESLGAAQPNGSAKQLWAINTDPEKNLLLRNLSNGRTISGEGATWKARMGDNGWLHLTYPPDEWALGIGAEGIVWRDDPEGPSTRWGIYRARTAKEERPDFELTGWASAGKGTTGGARGKIVTASRPEELVDYISQTEPLIIRVRGLLDFRQPFNGFKSNARYYVKSNKTILGIGSDAELRNGELRLAGVNNIIIRNLRFSHAPDTSIAITHGTSHVWIDHNDFSGADDGLLDITRAADFITVSWNRFSNHNKVSLVGSGDTESTDRGHLRVTYHHNWFHNTTQRHPRVRYGKVHLFNNYLEVDSYGVGIGVEAKILSENNFVRSARRVYQPYDTSDQPGSFTDKGSIFFELTGAVLPQRNDPPSWSPRAHYPYTLNHPINVPSLVRNGAGVGRIEAPPQPEPKPALPSARRSGARARGR